MFPSLYANSTYYHNGGLDVEILTMKFKSLLDAVSIAQETHVALREDNWYVYECNLLSKKRISLKSLYDMGLFSKEINTDCFGIYYNWKSYDKMSLN